MMEKREGGESATTGFKKRDEIIVDSVSVVYGVCTH